MNIIMNRQQINWINCAKFIAIFAVLVDHTNGLLYSNSHVRFASYYSVSLFIIISGYLCYKSNASQNISYGKTIVKSCKKILGAYLLATGIYIVVEYHFWDFQTFVSAVIFFNASSPFYYVLLYVQLMIINKLLYSVLVQMSNIKTGVLLGGVLGITYLTTNYTNILGIYGGGGKLFGGTYLALFYLGMMFAKYCIFEINSKKAISCLFIVSGLCCVGWGKIIWLGFQPSIDSKVPFGNGVNPPSITFSLLAIFMLFLCYSLFTICSWNKYAAYLAQSVGWIGKHTMYIFLYHRLWLDFYLERYLQIENINIKRVIYFFVMVFASIMLEYVVRFIVRLLVNCYNKSQRNILERV